MTWWQHLPRYIDPNIFTLGSFQLRYYGLMYIVGFAILYLLTMYRIKNEKYNYTKELIQNYFTWAILGVIIGARLGYVFFYDLSSFMKDPISIISPFDFSNGFKFIGISGLSYHGGLIGILTSLLIFSKKNNIKFWHFAGLFAPSVPLGYMFGRIGNFLNGELYGRVTEVPWGMYFPMDSLQKLRHPSQLYEALFEGLLLFVFLWFMRKRVKGGTLSGLYLVGYGIVRFFIEFTRQPDAHLGFVLGQFSMGQLLCFGMITIGIIMIFISKRMVKDSS